MLNIHRQIGVGLSVLFVSGNLYAQSQQPSPSAAKNESRPPQKESAPPDQQPEIYQRGTEDTPVSVKLLNTGKNEREAAQETQYEQDQAATNWWMLCLTGAVAAFTFVLAAAATWQAVLTRKAVRDQGVNTEASLAEARKSAAAAQELARILELGTKNVQRPYVYLTDMRMGFTMTTPSIKITFHNYGKTPANIELAIFRIKILDHMPGQADEITETTAAANGLVSPIEIIIPDGGDWVDVFNSEDQMNISQQQEIQKGDLGFYVWGKIAYRDIFRDTHCTNFCRKYDGRTGRFEPIGGRKRNHGN